jgi:hypothetical protein
MEIIKLEYKELKKNYTEVKDFLQERTAESIRLDSKIAEDLGHWGDDNYFLLVEFIEKYKLNFDEFDYSLHFESEGELFNSLTALFTVICLPFLLLALFLKWIFPTLKTPFDETLKPRKNEREDLTFGDLIVSKLKGEFCLRSEIKIEIV